jgi:hypothetical protein
MDMKEICVNYLRKLRGIATKHNLTKQLDSLIESAENGSCKPTQEECELLSRMVDDERLARQDIPIFLDKSYRKCEESGVFDKIKKLRHVGIYSRVSAELFKEEHGKEL